MNTNASILYGLRKMGLLLDQTATDVCIFIVWPPNLPGPSSWAYELTTGKVSFSTTWGGNQLSIPGVNSVSIALLNGFYPNQIYQRAVFSADAPGGGVIYWDVTDLLEWLSSDTTAMDVSNSRQSSDSTNQSPAGGFLTVHNNAGPAVTITASYLTQGSTLKAITPEVNTPNALYMTDTMLFNTTAMAASAAPTLVSLLITPNYTGRSLNDATSMRFFLTGCYSDQSYKDLTTTCVWAVTEANGDPMPTVTNTNKTTAAVASFSSATGFEGRLDFNKNAFGSSRIIAITAVFNMTTTQTMKAIGNISIDAYTS